MAGEWRTSTWGDEISLEYGKALRGYDDAQGQYRVFGSNGPIGWTSEPLAQGPGVILGRKGAYRGVQYSHEPFFVIDTAYYVVPKTDLDMRWLYYATKHYKLGEIDDGSPIPSTTRAAVYMIGIDVPPHDEQCAIADILGALDDKIELNQRMNETLEAIARALFKSWFIDFDPVRAKAAGSDPGLPKHLAELFSDSFEEGDLGEMPKEWRVVPLSEVTITITKGTTPTKAELETGGADREVNYVRVNAIGNDGSILFDKLTSIPSSVHFGVLKRSILAANDLLYTIAGTIGRSCIVDESFLPANANQAVAIIRPKPPMSPVFLAFTMRQEGFRQELHRNIVQAVQANLSLGMLSRARVVLPPALTLRQLFEPIELLVKRIALARAESRKLAAIRDSIVPKLISGEIRVKDPELMAGNSV